MHLGCAEVRLSEIDSPKGGRNRCEVGRKSFEIIDEIEIRPVVEIKDRNGDVGVNVRVASRRWPRARWPDGHNLADG